jgi:hypothetical protein
LLGCLKRHCTIPSNKFTNFAETTSTGCEKLLKTVPIQPQFYLSEYK